MLPIATTATDIGELFKDPALTVACVLLIVVSIEWIVVSRIIVRRMKKALRRGRMVPRIDVVKPPKDIWSYPPQRKVRAWEGSRSGE